jgi:hypothetical protein
VNTRLFSQHLRFSPQISKMVFADRDSCSRLVWIVDVLPNEIAPYMNAQMDQAALAMQKAFRRSAA